MTTLRLGADSVPCSMTNVFLADEEGDELRVMDYSFEIEVSVSINLTNVSPVAAYLITGFRRSLGWPRKLAINGHEYNRRRRSR